MWPFTPGIWTKRIRIWHKWDRIIFSDYMWHKWGGQTPAWQVSVITANGENYEHKGLGTLQTKCLLGCFTAPGSVFWIRGSWFIHFFIWPLFNQSEIACAVCVCVWCMNGMRPESWLACGTLCGSCRLGFMNGQVMPCSVETLHLPIVPFRFGCG